MQLDLHTNTTDIKTLAPLPIRSQRALLGALRPALERHDRTIELLHPRGKIFLRELFSAQDELVALLGREDMEVLDAALSEPAPAPLARQIEAHVAQMQRRVALVEALEEEDEEVVRALRGAYALPARAVAQAPRVRLIRALRGASSACTRHASTLKRYGADAASLAAPHALQEELAALPTDALWPPLPTLLTIEEVAARVADRLNKALVIAQVYRDEHPALLSELDTALKQHGAA